MNFVSDTIEELKEGLAKNIPALDCATNDPKEMEKLYLEFKAISEQFRLLSSYAYGKQMAMICRKEGKIKSALRFEDACDSVYKQLPTWAKW